MSMCTTTEPMSQSTLTEEDIYKSISASIRARYNSATFSCDIETEPVIDETKLPPTTGWQGSYKNLANERSFIESELRSGTGFGRGYLTARLAEINAARDKAIAEMAAEMATTQPDDTDPDVEQQIVETVVDDPKVPEVQEDEEPLANIVHETDLPWPYSDYFAMPGAPMAPAGLLRVSALPLTARLGHKDWE